jgi:hypothetical protein
MSAARFALLVAIVGWGECVDAEDVAPPQRGAKIEVSAEGVWRVPLRYWSHHPPFFDAGGFTFLTEVVSLGPEVPPQDQQELPLQFRTGMLRVKEVLTPAKGRPKEFEKIKTLDVEGTEGLKVGDRVIVLVDPEAYEGGFVMNYHTGGCILGLRLPPKDDLSFGKEEEKTVLDFLRSGRFLIETMTSDEMRAWMQLDPAGIAVELVREVEKGRLKWVGEK